MGSMWIARSFFGLIAIFVASSAGGQTPQPFPRPGGATTPPVATPSPAQPAPQPAPVQEPAAQQAPPTAPPASTPAVPALPVPLYPAAQFLTSYEAGRGQRYYVFGTTASFSDLVAYYRTQLKDRGNLVFEEPPTHMFEVGRFRVETMAFPPSVTIKDWTFGGSQGYPNPQRGGQPARFPTIIMIVPPPPGTAAQ